MFCFLSFLHSHHVLPANLQPITALRFISCCVVALCFAGIEPSSGLAAQPSRLPHWLSPAVMCRAAWPTAAQPAFFCPTPVPRPVSVPQLQPHPLHRGPPKRRGAPGSQLLPAKDGLPPHAPPHTDPPCQAQSVREATADHQIQPAPPHSPDPQQPQI